MTTRDAAERRSLGPAAQQADGIGVTTTEELDAVCAGADGAARALEQLGREGRAVMLTAMAAELEARREELVPVADS